LDGEWRSNFGWRVVVLSRCLAACAALVGRLACGDRALVAVATEPLSRLGQSASIAGGNTRGSTHSVAVRIAVAEQRSQGFAAAPPRERALDSAPRRRRIGYVNEV